MALATRPTITISPDIVPGAISGPQGRAVNQGSIDFLSYCPRLNGWIACGWIALGWVDDDEPVACTLDFGDVAPVSEGVLCLFPRDDVRQIGTGFVLFVPGGRELARRALSQLQLRSATQLYVLRPSHNIQREPEAEAMARTRAQLVTATRSARRERLFVLLNRPSFDGRDTLNDLQSPIFLETDAAILCPPGALILRGWLADPFHQVARVSLRCGAQRAVLDPARWVPIARPDVREAMQASHPGITENCGFMAYLPDACTPGEASYYEIETNTGEILFKKLPPYRGASLATIKETLSVFDLRYQEMVEAYDHVIGPAITALNRFRCQSTPVVREMAFGAPPADPACTLIIPLYGRIDFMEYQLALFTRALPPGTEIIYVLDDPRQARAAEILAAACLARFGLAFRLLVLSENVGYARANNIGIARARAPHLCLLNSDVFPKSADWLAQMLQTAAADPAIGAVGAVLLFEDETIQHAGCAFETLPEFGGWRFALHPGKGRLPGPDSTPVEVDAITGACLLMRTDLARQLGGLDEGYVIGDFEDIDLCCRIRGLGLRCVVDRQARLYHLERQSQGSQRAPWRLNLTLYNAWRFQRAHPASVTLEAA